MSFIVDVSDHNFQEEVVQASFEKLVVVDFWADWCGPCKTLKPILEKIAGEYAGAFILAKIDTEKSMQLPALFQIQSIPDVRFIKDGRMVGGFQGAIPESEIRKKLAPFLPELPKNQEPTWKTLMAEGQWEKAIPFLEREIAREEKTELLLSLGRAQLAAQQWPQAKATLQRVSSTDPLFNQVEFMEALISVHDLKLDSSNKMDQFLAEAQKQLKAKALPEAMEALIDVLFRDVHYRDELVRKAAVALVELLPPDEKKRYQRQLSMAVHA
ncbi:MAG: tetratricopeptide repeat protein [Acidobacteria bacterium]|nr:tetratricopeptide repeat protein [Acidobacteriota bacterium]MCB9397692.1 tetratricopeptide repeat protein [Acidobacteriota bacterium]